jgi:unsaturated chondroitin disaccharide hydrolase
MIELKSGKSDDKKDLDIPIVDAFNYVLEKIERNIEPLRDKFPFISKNGVWETKKNTSGGVWTLGFWPGMLWLAYMETKNKKYEKLAYDWMRLIEHRKNDRDHDVGFAFYPSFVKGYELAGDAYLREVALSAANSLLSLFHTKSNFIHTRLKESGIAAIDTTMNLLLLWWAYEETKDKRYYDAAFNHSIATMKHMIRDDGSTVHIVKFNPMNGKIIKKLTLQGYSDTSCWSRGQSWAMYGFTVAYEKTGYDVFLITAKRTADYFISHLPADCVPYWDFNTRIYDTTKDSSAAAIASSTLLDLAKVEKDKNAAMRYERSAYKILESLTKHYLTKGRNEPGILMHNCFDKPRGLATDNCTIFGDYYYMGALTKLLELESKQVPKKFDFFSRKAL